MILWIVLLCLVLVLSFVLAARSMRDFQEVSVERDDYGLFLIRKPKNLSTEFLSSLQKSLKSGQVLSFERLFKGNESALVVFGPGKLLFGFSDLDLLELEDYTNAKESQISACLVGIKNTDQLKLTAPQLSKMEQFWWQLNLSHQFKAQIRAVLIPDPLNKADIADILQDLAPGKLFILPKAFSNAQMLKVYQERGWTGGKQFSLSAKEILQLLFV